MVRRPLPHRFRVRRKRQGGRHALYAGHQKTAIPLHSPKASGGVAPRRPHIGRSCQCGRRAHHLGSLVRDRPHRFSISQVGRPTPHLLRSLSRRYRIDETDWPQLSAPPSPGPGYSPDGQTVNPRPSPSTTRLSMSCWPRGSSRSSACSTSTCRCTGRSRVAGRAEVVSRPMPVRRSASKLFGDRSPAG